MLQHLVLAHSGLFLSYWGGRPLAAFAALVLVHLFCFDVPHSQDIGAATRLLAIIAGCGIGGMYAWLIQKPVYRFHSQEFSLKSLIVALLYGGTLVAWQMAPQKFWNYFFVSSLPQLFLIVCSYLQLEHSDSWELSPRASATIHWHYLVLWFLLQPIFFSIGQTARPDLPHYYWLVGWVGAACMWYCVMSFTILGTLIGRVEIKAIVLTRKSDGTVDDDSWAVVDPEESLGQSGTSSA